MNFIEGIFGVTPDANSGVLELLLVIAPLIGLLLRSRLRLRPTRR